MAILRRSRSLVPQLLISKPSDGPLGVAVPHWHVPVHLDSAPNRLGGPYEAVGRARVAWRILRTIGNARFAAELFRSLLVPCLVAQRNAAVQYNSVRHWANLSKGSMLAEALNFRR